MFFTGPWTVPSPTRRPPVSVRGVDEGTVTSPPMSANEPPVIVGATPENARVPDFANTRPEDRMARFSTPAVVPAPGSAIRVPTLSRSDGLAQHPAPAMEPLRIVIVPSLRSVAIGPAEANVTDALAAIVEARFNTSAPP